MPKRKAIPRDIKQTVLLEACYMCANPRCRHILTLELHHISWVKEGGGNDPENLLALCPNCHALHTKGEIPTEALKVWKGMLAAINNPHRISADILLFLFRYTENSIGQPLRFSADGLLQLTELLSAGLVEIIDSTSSGGYWGPIVATYGVRLTEVGESLVNAWLEGNAQKFEQIISPR